MGIKPGQLSQDGLRLKLLDRAILGELDRRQEFLSLGLRELLLIFRQPEKPAIQGRRQTVLRDAPQRCDAFGENLLQTHLCN